VWFFDLAISLVLFQKIILWFLMISCRETDILITAEPGGEILHEKAYLNRQMDELDELELLSLVAKVCTELENHIGVSDKILSEFILSLYDRDLSVFKLRLQDNGAEFPETFVSNLHRLITQMIPGLLAEPEKERMKQDVGVFPALALANTPHSFQDDEPLTAKSAIRRPLTPPKPHKYEIDREPVLFKVYSGRVTNLKDFGAFVALDGIAGRREGLLHVSAISSSRRIGHPSEILRRGQTVKVKIASISGEKLGLNMKDVDQTSGRDLAPELNRAPGGGSNAVPIGELGRLSGGDSLIQRKELTAALPPPKRTQRISSPELWEIKQLIASGVLNPADYPTVHLEGADANELEFQATEEELDIEIRDEEPLFLKGQTSRTLDLSPVQIVKVPDGSLNRAAMAGSAFAKERKELKKQRENEELDAVPRDVGQTWADPMAAPSDRQFAQDAKAVARKIGAAQMPEWKRETLGKSGTFGKRTNLSIKEQRETLPVFKLRSDIIRAVSENQILVVIGDTG
jgi:ATP-dependent RNA helicase DHX8/PRP22